MSEPRPHDREAAGAEADLASLVFQDFRRAPAEDASAAGWEGPAAVPSDSVLDLFRPDGARRSGPSGPSGPVRRALPRAGQELFGFRLRHELGRGAFARVFLAEQAGLAGRPVVLKVSGLDGHEPQTLAQLQHTHIVPIYSVHEDARAGLRAVCMPYFGGASLAHVLEQLWAGRAVPARGLELAHALAAVGGPFGPDTETRRHGDTATEDPLVSLSPCLRVSVSPAAPDLWDGLSYVQAAAWVVARLAEALAHAHQRGVLHRDIKPSNVLLGHDGQPMLLDFNLAQPLDDADGPAAASLGGTVAYMAPEHLRAVARRDPALARLVDRRADVYALGMVLYEMLTGRRPFAQSASCVSLPALIEAMAVERLKAAPSARRGRGDVPWGLESILRQCLAPDPAHRYQRAEHLAEDLARFLDDRPLRHAPELSRVERLRKWARRHPRLASSGLVTAAASLLLATAGAALFAANRNLASTQGRLEVAEGDLESAHSRERVQAYEEGTRRALCLVNTTTDLGDHLADGLCVCEKTLAVYRVLECDDWEDLPEWRRLARAERLRLGEDTRDLLLLLAAGRVRQAPENAEAVRQALTLVSKALAIRGLSPSPALYEEQGYYCELLGDQAGARAARAVAARLPPACARDHYLLALACARRGDAGGLSRAAAELDRALELSPQHFWSRMQRGFCRQELGEYTLAAADFSYCTALWPDFAWGHFNLGCVLYQEGKKAAAVSAYDAALRYDGGLVLAWFNRGLARLELGRDADALADFDRAAELGRDDAALHAGRGMALERLGRADEADAAFAAALARAGTAPRDHRLRLLCSCGFAVAARRPREAGAAFDRVLAEEPEHAQALYGQALLATRAAEAFASLPAAEGPLLLAAGRAVALGWFHRAVRADPTLVEARRYRAVLWARCGLHREAGDDIKWCLGREPQSGATLYAAACVSALAAAQADAGAAELAARQALHYLEMALERGYGHDRAAGDPDLAAVARRPRFRELLQMTR